ncbi:MAG TPA: hypothetical protein DEQ86_06180 [Candidatus Jacksonbacteria bacterium]|nr:hypothetical protein [Candidatus Jacksonbacteria bacterium]
MSKPNIHLVPYKGEWAVRREGSSRVSSIYDTKVEADQSGREMARNDKVELIIHDRRGVIRDKDSFGHDPRNIRDTVF